MRTLALQWLRARPIALILLLILVIVTVSARTAAVAVPQQTPTPTVSQIQVIKATIPVVQVTPSTHPLDPVTMRERLAPSRFASRSLPRALLAATPPATLAWKERLTALKESGIQAPASPPAEFRLSLREPYRREGASLSFMNAFLADAARNSVLLLEPSAAGGTGILTLAFRADPRARYLVDMSVATDPPATFQFSGDVPVTVTLDREVGHLLVVVEARASGEAGLMVHSPNRTWVFYEVAVTKIQ